MTSCGRSTMAFNRRALAAADDGSPDTSFKEEAGPERTMSYIVGLSAKEDAERMEKKEKMKKQLTLHEKGVINPQRSRVIPYWDATIFAALIFTALLTPFEVSLLKDSIPTSWVVANYVINSVFGVDMILQFFLAYQESPKKGGRWVTRQSLIVKHYLRTWFALDLVSVIPFDALGKSIMLSMGDENTDAADVLRLIRTIRLIRLIKLLRILRASRILARWQNFIGLSYAQVTMVKFISIITFMAHILACAWGWVGLNWTPTPGVSLESEASWIDHYGMHEYSARRLYFVSMYVSVLAMFGGVGSITPQNFMEYSVLTAMLLFGSMVWAWVIGSLCGILATLNPHVTLFRYTMDELNHFMNDAGFDTDHRVRVREFFRQTQEYSRIASYEVLLEKMSAQLRGDTALLMGAKTLEKVWYLKINDVEKEFLAIVALSLKASVYETRELIMSEDLTVIVKGMCARKLRIMVKGAVFGVDCIIPDNHSGLRDVEPAHCLTFVQTTSISRATIFEVCEPFPVAMEHIRRCARHLTLRAALRKHLERVKAKMRRARHRAAHGVEARAKAEGWHDEFKADPVAATREHPAHGCGRPALQLSGIAEGALAPADDEPPPTSTRERRARNTQYNAAWSSRPRDE